MSLTPLFMDPLFMEVATQVWSSGDHNLEAIISMSGTNMHDSELMSLASTLSDIANPRFDRLALAQCT